MADLPHIRTTVSEFLSQRLWRLDCRDQGRVRAMSIRALRVLVLAVKKYVNDHCALRASALTFYSLLAVVPVAALAFGIAKGFGLEQRLETQLYQRLEGQEAVVERIIAFSRNLLENTQGGLIAGIGVVILFWSALKVLNHIEGSLNTIWRVRSRSTIRKFTDYLTIMVISPLLVIISSSVNVYIRTQVTSITHRLPIQDVMGPAIFFLLKLVPYGLIWLLFFLIYQVMPNTRVRIRSAVVAGLIAGTIYQLSQAVYIHAQVLLANYNAVYGSFAALPFFLIWIQLSWIIVLFGAQIAYAHQHADQHASQLDYQETGAGSRRQYALYLLRHVIGRFQTGAPAADTQELARELRLPHGFIVQLTDRLVQCGLLSEVLRHADAATGFQPARDIQGITIADMLSTWDGGDADPQLFEESNAAYEKVRQSLAAVDRTLRDSAANRLIKDI
ncbi:MAG: YihY/virulence factor BrkB family protein [Desulfatitalea sp.]|nr:YihY/virulence factor BrkB family protein [Desulfatitalea sp.]NNK01114.1 YihY/virulence factor BrkB family protein [Desulfatitalea sp.]